MYYWLQVSGLSADSEATGWRCRGVWYHSQHELAAAVRERELHSGVQDQRG